MEKQENSLFQIKIQIEIGNGKPWARQKDIKIMVHNSHIPK